MGEVPRWANLTDDFSRRMSKWRLCSQPKRLKHVGDSSSSTRAGRAALRAQASPPAFATPWGAELGSSPRCSQRDGATLSPSLLPNSFSQS